MLNKLLISVNCSAFLPKTMKAMKAVNELTKFKLSVLNGIVTVASYSLYATPYSCLPLLASSIALSMSSQALNQYMEIELDKKMLRTCKRPLVMGLNKNYALGLGLGLGIAGLYGISMYNTLSAGIGFAIWSSYLFIYTRMKQKS
jgi:heme O synthase-like polyprenyltransferase